MVFWVCMCVCVCAQHLRDTVMIALNTKVRILTASKWRKKKYQQIAIDFSFISDAFIHLTCTENENEVHFIWKRSGFWENKVLLIKFNCTVCYLHPLGKYNPVTFNRNSSKSLCIITNTHTNQPTNQKPYIKYVRLFRFVFNAFYAFNLDFCVFFLNLVFWNDLDECWITSFDHINSFLFYFQTDAIKNDPKKHYRGTKLVYCFSFFEKRLSERISLAQVKKKCSKRNKDSGNEQPPKRKKQKCKKSKVSDLKREKLFL